MKDVLRIKDKNTPTIISLLDVEISVVKEVFGREKWDLILSDGGSETKRPVLPEQLPLEMLTESNF